MPNRVDDAPAPARRDRRLGAARDPEDRVQWRDPAQIVVWRIGADTLKEGADLPSPFLQVRAQE